MKTQVIHLDPHDDLISIRDRMAWAKTPRILLVWPKRGRVDVRPLDLALLHRHAESLGAELGLVTREAEIRQTARRMNLPIFKTTSDAQREHWPERNAHPQRRFPKVDLRALRATLPVPELFNFSSQPIPRVAVFALGVLAVLIVALVFIPSAEVRINPPARAQSLTISVSAEKDASQVQISGLIPARETVLILEATESKTASGKSVLPDKLAAGMVRFTNLTTAPVPVPAKTVLLTRSNAPVRFETVKQAEIPAGKGQFADVPVRAITPGSAGNLPAGSLTVFEAPFGLSLSVTNAKTMTGGTDISKPAPTDVDLQSLRARLVANLKEQARAKIQAQLQPADVFFPATFTMTKVLDEAYAPAPNQPGEKVTLTLKAEFRADYASADDLEKLAQLALDASLPPGEEPVAKTLHLQPVSALFGGAEGITRWQVRAERQIRPRVDSAQVISMVQGKTARRAGSLLQQMFGMESPPQISIRPFFWPWLPYLPFRITVSN